MQSSLLYWTPLIYLVLINLIAFFAMWYDKRCARQHHWRVAEATLHIIGAIGGAIGIFAGMFRFRHKTQKRSFQAVAVVALVISLIIYWLIISLYLH